MYEASSQIFRENQGCVCVGGGVPLSTQSACLIQFIYSPAAAVCFSGTKIVTEANYGCRTNWYNGMNREREGSSLQM